MGINKNEEGKRFGGCLVGGEEEKKRVGLRCFLPELTRKFFPIMERKLLEDFDLFIDQNANVHLNMDFCLVCNTLAFSFSFFPPSS